MTELLSCGSGYTMALPAPATFVINDGMVTIRPDGSIEFGPDYKPEEAAKLFWDAIGLERKNRA